jgi:hypothetical protein
MGKKDYGFNVYFEEVKIRIRHQLVSPRVMIAHKTHNSENQCNLPF